MGSEFPKDADDFELLPKIRNFFKADPFTTAEEIAEYLHNDNSEVPLEYIRRVEKLIEELKRKKLLKKITGWSVA